MREELKNKCDLFIKNKKAIKDAFLLKEAPTSGAILLSGKDVLADTAELKKTNEVLKANEGVLSSLRSHMKEPVVCMMYLSEDPDTYIKKLRRTYDALNKRRFFDNEYDVISAMIVNQQTDDSNLDECVDKILKIYDAMKDYHLLQTSGQDMPFAAILASSERPVEELMKDGEECYQLLRKRFPLSGAVQPLSYILAINPASPEEKVNKAIKLFEEFKKAGLKYGKSFELASLGALVAMDESVEEIVAETKEAFDYINNNHGYGLLEADKHSKIMNASMLVLMSRKDLSAELEGAALSAQMALSIAIELTVIMVTASIVSASTHN